MMLRFLSIACMFLIAGILPAQDTLPGKPGPGKLNLVQDARIPLLVQKHVKFNSLLKSTMDGYRIQIFFDSGADSKKRAMDAKSEFAGKFPEISSYLSFQEPFYKIRVGDYRYKLEADGVLELIRADYPNAFTVKDRVFYPKL